jgi:hypothetical protein
VSVVRGPRPDIRNVISYEVGLEQGREREVVSVWSDKAQAARVVAALMARMAGLCRPAPHYAPPK